MAQVVSTGAIKSKATLPFLAQLPPFPAIAGKLLGLVTSPRVQFREVAELVRTDPAFAARALRLANSPLMGGREISSILQALSILGSERLNSLVMTLAVHQLVSKNIESRLQRRCWRHSLATALLAETLSPHFPGLTSDGAYTAGLLHDIGCLVFASCRSQDYDELLRSTQTIDQQLAAERQVYGLDHSELGALLVDHWQLPQALRPVLSSHHDQTGPQHSLLALVHISDCLANQLGFALCEELREDSIEAPPDWIQPAYDLDELCHSVLDRINRLECSLL